MKRSPMPPRKTWMPRGDSQMTRTRLAPVSLVRRRENRERKAMVAGLWPERPLCVVYVLSQDNPGVIPDEVISACGRWADDLHEPHSRARGGAITDPDNSRPLCRPCHEALGLEPAWGYLLDLIRHSWDAPKGGEAA